MKLAEKTLWQHPIEDCAFSSQGVVKFGFAVESEKWCIDKSAKNMMKGCIMSNRKLPESQSSEFDSKICINLKGPVLLPWGF